MAEFADTALGLGGAVQFTQVSFEASARAFVSFEFAAREFPEAGKNALGRSAAQKDFALTAHDGERPSYLLEGLAGLRSG